MRSRVLVASLMAVLGLRLLAREASAQVAAGAGISYDEAIALAARVAPDVAVAQRQESVSHAEIGVAGTYPNPTLIGGTSTQAAVFSGTVSLPLVILGQRGAAMRSGRADYETVRVDTSVVVNDARAAAAHAFVALWLAERTAGARADAAIVTRRLETAVLGRVELGASPEVEGLRVRAERLRADADAAEAAELVDAAASGLGLWVGIVDARGLRPRGDPTVPELPPPLADLLPRVSGNPAARREDFDARAAEVRADRERALVRPTLAVDLGADLGDPTLNFVPNYRAQLAMDVPLFNQRGAYIEREKMNRELARARGDAQRKKLGADLTSAYLRFQAVSGREKALREGVVPAADAAAAATEESYTMGRAQLVVVLDAQRTRIEARMSLIEAEASRADDWVDVMQATAWR